MAKARPFTVKFPMGGVNKRYGYQQQAPFTSPGASNIWPTQWDTGRQRGGTRPGLTALASVSPSVGTPLTGTPYNWCEATWESGEVHYRGVAVTTSTGTWVSTDGVTWNERITTAPGGSFASCAVYNQVLYQASTETTAIKTYNFVGGATGDLSDAGGGTAPSECGIVITWGDRLLFGGDIDDPHIVHMSRIGDPTDWNHADVDASAAVGTAGLNGVIGEPVTSLVPHNSDCLLIGCTDSTYAVRGNPRANGQFYKLSNQIGPLMQSAWCKTGNDFTFFMSRDGLYYMRPGCGEPPVSVSRERLPDELVAIDPGDSDLERVSLAYDARWRGIHIYVTYTTAADVYYFYDLQNEGFWPMAFSGRQLELAVPLKSASTATTSALLALDGSDVFQFDTASTETINSHLWYGPIALGNPHTEGALTELSATLAEDSGDVSWSIYAGNSPQEAFNGSAKFTGADWDIQGFNYSQNPHVGGVAAYLKLEDSSNSSWSVEEIIGVRTEMGRRRV